MELKLGKKETVFDPKTIKMMSIWKDKKLPDFPPKFDGPIYPLQMWGNDKHGDCVMCGAANVQTRSEMVEQKIIIPITEYEVEKQYFVLSGGADSGLVMLDTAKFWRKHGLFLAKHQYRSYAFASIHDAPENVKAVVSIIGDAWCGFSMPDNWKEAVDAGNPWTDTSLPASPYNGHCMTVGKYDPDWVWVKTWGQWMQMSWAWFLKYNDERYSIIDAKDSWLKDSPIDVEALYNLLLECGADVEAKKWWERG